MNNGVILESITEYDALPRIVQPQMFNERFTTCFHFTLFQVGVDPLLRTSIWNHLLDITSSMGKHSTIVITTHYIEEVSPGTPELPNEKSESFIFVFRRDKPTESEWCDSESYSRKTRRKTFYKSNIHIRYESWICWKRFPHFRYSKPNLEDVFLELCLLDGDMETAKVRAERQERTPLIVTKHRCERNTCQLQHVFFVQSVS